MAEPQSDETQGTTETGSPNLSTEHQQDGDARFVSDTMGREKKSEETIPRKSSLL